MRVFRCYNCNAPQGYEFISDKDECPSCHSTWPAVLMLSVVHYLKQDREGKVPGAFGRRFRCVCDPSKSNLMGEPHSGEPAAVSCPVCKQDQDWQRDMAKHIEMNRGPGDPPPESTLAKKIFVPPVVTAQE